MPSIVCNIRGVEAAEASLKQLAAAAVQVGKSRYFIGTPLPRGRWQEKGFHPRGGTRLVKGLHYLRKAADAEGAAIAAALPAALEKGPEAVAQLYLAEAGKVKGKAQAGAPSRGGGLRGSITVVVGARK